MRNRLYSLAALALVALTGLAFANPNPAELAHREAVLGEVIQHPVLGVASKGGPIAPDGTEIQNDLPQRFHLKNVGGSDGAGLCVFASNTHASIWQNVRQTVDLFQFMQRYPGGGWPEKLDQYIAMLCRQKGVPIPDYIQVESRDLKILELATKSGRIPGITYNYSPTGEYGGRRIAHMVNLMHLDLEKGVAAILDNNFPGRYEWMDVATFMRVYALNGNGWAVIFLNPGPPPVPFN